LAADAGSERRGERRIILNIFYEEPDGDRWLPFDRHPRRVVRRLVRGKPQPGGQRRVFLNLCAGLDRIGVQFRVNDYRHANENPVEPACIVGKPPVLDKNTWLNPILFGSAVFSHPIDDPHLLDRVPIKKILVPGQWMKEMWRPHWDQPVVVWPVGIDTDRWRPADPAAKDTDVLLYDKVRWEHDRYAETLINPIRRALMADGRSCREIRYGHYREDEFHTALARCRTMIFLCEHETQGIAYQQALSCGVPILAWDRGGFLQDPAYFPDRVRFQPVTSVPYWDERCGMTFASLDAFHSAWAGFWETACRGEYRPRDYVVENLTLESCAEAYMRHVRDVCDDCVGRR
jgi:glycosyltransferase involved in cell wall biosynthesis